MSMLGKAEITRRLRGNKQHWLLTEMGKHFALTKTYYAGKSRFTGQSVYKTVTARLLQKDSGGFHIEWPRYPYTSRVAHLRPKQLIDERACYMKTVLFSLIRLMRETGMRRLIENKDWVEVNDNCEKADKGALAHELNNLL